jgi:hypothetical protein
MPIQDQSMKDSKPFWAGARGRTAQRDSRPIPQLTGGVGWTGVSNRLGPVALAVVGGVAASQFNRLSSGTTDASRKIRAFYRTNAGAKPPSRGPVLAG